MPKFTYIMTRVAFAALFFFIGFLAQPIMYNDSEFLAELMACQIETREACAFVVMPESAYPEVQLLYSMHVK
jgi:hypothetical protein